MIELIDTSHAALRGRLTTKPMDHQLAAFEKIKRSKVGALFMDMGTGKSLVVIMLALARREKISKVIWCCPVSLKLNTARQIKKHTDIRDDDVFVFDNKVDDATLPEAQWFVIGLESIGSSSRATMAFNALVDEDTMVVVDESSYIKGHRSKRTKRLTLIGSRARYRLVLNGTPISQGVEDLYAQMRFLSEKILGYGSWYSFQRAHIRWSEKFKGRIDERVDTDYLMKCIEPYVYQVTKKECLDIPDKRPTISRWVPLTNKQKELYEFAKDCFEEEAMAIDNQNADELGILIYKLFGSLQAIANGVTPFGLEEHGNAIENNKTKELLIILKQIQSSHIIVWCRYRKSIQQVANVLKSEFPLLNVCQYHGGLNERQRDESLSQWESSGGVFLATEGCGGYGLDLIASDYTIFYSNSFKYSERIQAEDRVHRIGQKRSPTYIDIWSDCGIEGRIKSAIRNKGDALEIFRRELYFARERGKDAVQSILGSL